MLGGTVIPLSGIAGAVWTDAIECVTTEPIGVGGNSSKGLLFGKAERGASQIAFVKIGRDRIQYESLAIGEPVPSELLYRAPNASRPTC